MGSARSSTNHSTPIMFPSNPNAQSSKPQVDSEGVLTQIGSIPDSVLSNNLFP